MPLQRAIAIVGAAALAFGAVAASEPWTLPPTDAAPIPSPSAISAPANPGPPRRFDPELDQALLDRLLARPLFREGRRPAVDAPLGAAATDADLPRLAGVLVSSQARSAIFAPSADGKPVVVGVGGSVSAFRVQAIEAGQVTMVGANGSMRVLRPGFDPRQFPADAASQGPANGAVTRQRPRPAIVTLSAPLQGRAASARVQRTPPR